MFKLYSMSKNTTSNSIRYPKFEPGHSDLKTHKRGFEISILRLEFGASCTKV